MKAEAFIRKFLDWAKKSPPCLVDGIAHNKWIELIQEAEKVIRYEKPTIGESIKRVVKRYKIKPSKSKRISKYL